MLTDEEMESLEEIYNRKDFLMSNTVKCAACGALVHKETGETKFGKDDPAFNIESLKAENARLKSEIDNLMEVLHGKKENREDVREEGDEADPDFDWS